MDSSAKRRFTGLQVILIIISIACMFGTGLLSAPEGLSPSGFKLLGIIIGSCILWVGIDTTWPNLLTLLALMTIPELPVKQIISTSFGNETVGFLIFCMMLAAVLTKTGIAKRLAISFLTNRLARKSSWWTAIMLYAASFLICSFVSSPAGIVITLPITIEMLNNIKSEKKSETATMLIMGSLVFSVLANCCTPIAHAMSLQGMSLYQSYTGNELEFFVYCVTLLPVAIVCGLVYILICKYIWKPDIRCMKDLDHEMLASSLPPMSTREKIASAIYIIVAVFWILPGVCKYATPSLYGYLSWIDKCYPPIVAILLLNFITVKGEPVLEYKEAFGNISWSTILFIATINCLGANTANKDIGLPAWLTEVLTPIFSGVNVFAFALVIIVFCAIFTNFASNAVAVALGYAIAMPLTLTIFNGSISPVLMGLFITCSAQFSYATAPATPAAAICVESGWIDTKSMFKWGMIATLIFCVILLVIGTGITNLLGV